MVTVDCQGLPGS